LCTWELRAVKKIAILPTLFTLGNAVCGFAAIACASKITPANPIDPESARLFFYSGWLIMAAMLFDVFDGYVARLSRSASEFGGQLDSLCDAISFGAAPAFLLLRLGQDWEAQPMRNAIPVIAALYMVCAILRLARFNLENSPDPAYHKRFKGLPSPVAAGCLASLAMLRGQLPEILAPFEPALQAIVKYWAPAGAILVALLMVSRVSYPHLTKQLFRGRRHFSYLVRIVVAVFVVVLLQDLALVAIFWGYALTFLGRHALLHIKANQQFPIPSSGFDEHP
jgi:CDP-diacylglycerol--serine O-phosphatidyltransferase